MARVYKIFQRANYTYGKWKAMLTTFDNLKEAQDELTKLQAAEEKARTTGKMVFGKGLAAVQMAYSPEDYAEFKIKTREVSPWKDIS